MSLLQTAGLYERKYFFIWSYPRNVTNFQTGFSENNWDESHSRPECVWKYSTITFQFAQIIRKKGKWFGKGVLSIIIFYVWFFKLNFLYAFYYCRRKITKKLFLPKFYKNLVLKVFFFHLRHNVQEWLRCAPDYLRNISLRGSGHFVNTDTDSNLEEFLLLLIISPSWT